MRHVNEGELERVLGAQPEALWRHIRGERCLRCWYLVRRGRRHPLCRAPLVAERVERAAEALAFLDEGLADLREHLTSCLTCYCVVEEVRATRLQLVGSSGRWRARRARTGTGRWRMPRRRPAAAVRSAPAGEVAERSCRVRCHSCGEAFVTRVQLELIEACLDVVLGGGISTFPATCSCGAANMVEFDPAAFDDPGRVLSGQEPREGGR